MTRYRSNGFECPYCMGKAFTKHTGRANDGTVIIRKRRCAECNKQFTTFEVAAPEELTKHSIPYWDQDKQMMDRARKMRRPVKTDRARPAPRPLRAVPTLLYTLKVGKR